jgi:predicted transcriptional regulator
MEYSELIENALKGRSVNSMAKMWGVSQKTLDRYVKGESMPDFDLALKLVEEAGVDPAEAFRTLAEEAKLHKLRLNAENGGPPVSRTRHQRIMSPLL